MTEPPPGAGSDPRALRTVATRTAGGWLINGEKHLITGADGAAFAIVMARVTRTAGRREHAARRRATTPGMRVGEHARTLDRR